MKTIFILLLLSVITSQAHAQNVKMLSENLITLTATGLKVTPSASSSTTDFDFLVGQWKISNRKLKTRLSNNNEWLEFQSTLHMRKILQGIGNFGLTQHDDH